MCSGCWCCGKLPTLAASPGPQLSCAALLPRSPSRSPPLSAGRVLLAAADAVHAELQTAARQLCDLQANGPQTLTVATFASAGEPLLAPALTELTTAADNAIDVTVIEAEPDDALASLRSGGADLALVYHFHTRQPPGHWPGAAGPGAYIPLVDDHIRLLVPASHPLASQHVAALPELADDRWIQGWGDTGAVLDTLAATSGFRPRIACRSSDYRFMSALVSAGVGVALIPRLGLPDNPRVRDLAVTPQPIRYVGIYRPRRRWRHPTADRLLAALRHQAATMNSQ
jgi:DNA-binding transcriptional LysR family regulator